MEALHSQVYHFGKLFQDCKAAAEVFFREERVREPKISFRISGKGW